MMTHPDRPAPPRKAARFGLGPVGTSRQAPPYLCLLAVDASAPGLPHSLPS